MDLNKKRKDFRNSSKKEKKLKKLINKSDSDSEESEHELSHYLNDRVKLMKEVLKIIKPKKIKSMAPECMKKLDIEEINSMLLEELLGISNKRLKYIFNGQNLEEDSSSTDPEAEQQPIDLISLDDVTDDDFVIDLDSENETYKKRHKKHKPKIKEEGKRKKIKKEKEDKGDKSSKKSKDKMDEQNLMSVLELLELQARARAIRSQLTLETNKKLEEEEKGKKAAESDNDDAIIIESPKNIEIVITSESEGEDSLKNNSKEHKQSYSCDEDTKKKEENDLTSVQVTSAQNENVVNSESQNENDQTRTAVTNENTENKTAEDNQNKIINIETVILTPAKTSCAANSSENEKVAEKDKVAETDRKNEKSEDRELENVKEKNKNVESQGMEKTNTDFKSDSSNSSSAIYEVENSAVDEGDGIIINMEQSEIDCIISD